MRATHVALLNTNRHDVVIMVSFALRIGGVLFVMAPDSVFLGALGRLSWGPTVHEKMRAKAAETGKPALFVAQRAKAIAAVERLDEGSGRADVLAGLRVAAAESEVHIVTSIAGSVELHRVQPLAPPAYGGPR